MKSIPPALSAEEWACIETTGFISTMSPAEAIARHNHRLPDDDPRKITADTVALLRIAAVGIDCVPGGDWRANGLVHLADALASYLHPRTP